MPYKSLAQERFFHANKKKLVGSRKQGQKTARKIKKVG